MVPEFLQLEYGSGCNGTKNTNIQTLTLTYTYTYKHTNSHLHKHTNSHSHSHLHRRRPLSLISLTVSALNRSVRLQRLSFPSPSLRSKVLSLSLSLNAVVSSSLLLFVLLITNGCNFMKKKIPLFLKWVCVCKFCIFMHKLILGFDPVIN